MPAPETPPPSELLDAIRERLNDAAKDLTAAIRCIEAYQNDPKGAQSCIMHYLRTGEETGLIIRKSQ